MPIFGSGWVCAFANVKLGSSNQPPSVFSASKVIGCNLEFIKILAVEFLFVLIGADFPGPGGVLKLGKAE